MPDDSTNVPKPLSPELKQALKALLHLNNSDREIALTYIFKFWFNSDTQVLFLDEPLSIEDIELKKELLGNKHLNTGSEVNITKKDSTNNTDTDGTKNTPNDFPFFCL